MRILLTVPGIGGPFCRVTAFLYGLAGCYDAPPPLFVATPELRVVPG